MIQDSFRMMVLVYNLPLMVQLNPGVSHSVAPHDMEVATDDS